MDMEKYTSGKIYSFFEWVFRLATWNLLLVLITLAVMAIPYYVFYKIQDNNQIEQLEIVNDDIFVIQKNGRETEIFDRFKINDSGKLDFLKQEVVENNEKYFTYTIKFSNFEITYSKITNDYTTIYYENLGLYGENDSAKTLIDDQVLVGEVVESNLDRDMNLVISFENKVFNFGQCVETQSLASSIWLSVAIILGLFVFIPCFVTIFSMIKINVIVNQIKYVNRLYLIYICKQKDKSISI